MSRIAKWRFEKTKVKVVFRLQFNATHVPQTGWDKIFISFIPADSGKVTAKTTKGNVRNGTCKWADPIYETTRLLQDTRTKQYDEKLYKLVVAMGSTRSSMLGEASINLSDYADASQPSTVALPLHGCDAGTMLHVTVQLLTSKTGFREFEQQRELRERGLRASNDQNSYDALACGEGSYSEETVNDHIEKANGRGRLKSDAKQPPLREEGVVLNEGFDGSSNTSSSLYAEKHDISSINEVDSQKSATPADLEGVCLTQSPRHEKCDPSGQRCLAQGANDWVHGWGSDYSGDNDLASAYEEINRLRGSLEEAESYILELKMEVSSLQRNTSEIGVETINFSQKLAGEIASGEKLTKEVSLLKSECSKLREELKQQTNSKFNPPATSREASETDQGLYFQDLQLRWLNELFVVEDNLRQLQRKVCFGFQDTDFNIIYSDFEALLEVLQHLKQGIEHGISRLKEVPSERAHIKEIDKTSLCGTELFSGKGFDADFFQPGGMIHSISIPGIVSHECDSANVINSLKEKIIELLRDFDESKVERENLIRKMDQMECYYEALVQELEEKERLMLIEFKNLMNEHSTCLYTISSANSEIEKVRQDMSSQALRFSDEKHKIEFLNRELERRAITAEAALKRAHLNYPIAVGQLQKDLELLSCQVLTLFQANENLIRQAFMNPVQLAFQGDPETTQFERMESKEFDVAKVIQSQNQYAGLKKQPLDGDVLLEDSKRFLHLQEDLYQKVEEEVCEMHLANISLDVFSRALQENLLEASASVIRTKENRDELKQQLELSNKSKELLLLKLQSAMNDIHSVNEYNASWIAKCNDVMHQNQILDANLQNITGEYNLLAHKITEWEIVVEEYKSYQSKHQTCDADKRELVRLLKKETVENGHLQNEISILHEELKTKELKFDELAHAKENLLNSFNFLQGKLWTLLASHDKTFNGLSLSNDISCQDLESRDMTSVLLLLEELQHNAFEKILQLTEEKKRVADERDKARVSLTNAESDISVISKKFEQYKHDMVNKLDVFDDMVQKLQSKLEAFGHRLKDSTEAENKYMKQHQEFISDVDYLEAELQQLTSKNGGLAQEILVLESVNKELEKSKLLTAEITEENQSLVTSLGGKTKEFANLALEVNNLKGQLETLNDELVVERISKANLENIVTDLTSQLDEKHCQLLDIDQQKAELVHFKQLVSDLELEKSRYCGLLSHSEECLHILRKEFTSAVTLEDHLSEMAEHLITSDVKFIFTKTHYESQIEEHAHKLQSSSQHLVELQEKHQDAETILNHRVSSEARYVEENARLLTIIDSLRIELAASVVQNKVLHDIKDVMTAELSECKNQLVNLDVASCKGISPVEVEQLKHLLASSEEEIEKLILSKEEDEVKVQVIKAKLNEQYSYVTLLEGFKDKLIMLQNQYNELSQRLSEQIMKTEEFKNLSVHLKELNEKNEFESLQGREKRKPENPPVALQDSLRIAFIKEHYETGLQELKHQLSISKRHNDEMLLKLQDTVNELEVMKKSEVSHLKKNEELGMKILELEDELHSVVTQKREKVNAFDIMKAELECSLISLECCKEEKQKLEASLQICLEEKNKIVAYNTTKASFNTSSIGGNLGAHKVWYISDEPVSGKVIQENLDAATPSALAKRLPVQDSLLSGDIDKFPYDVKTDQENLLPSGSEYDHFKGKSLKSCMDYLNEEHERMKNENSLSKDDIESKQKDKSSFHLQSSFKKQHTADESVSKSFNYINEMLELKGSYIAVETELKEMHGRYSQLSLQFAEVEGERQKLAMMLKNAQTPPKKSKFLFRSSSVSITDRP